MRKTLPQTISITDLLQLRNPPAVQQRSQPQQPQQQPQQPQQTIPLISKNQIKTALFNLADNNNFIDLLYSELVKQQTS